MDKCRCCFSGLIKPQTVSNNYDSFDPHYACQIDSQGNVWTLGTNRTGNTERKIVIAKINGSTGALMNMYGSSLW